MNRSVLDASVALKWVLVEPSAPIARQIRQAYVSGSVELIAPETFLLEVAHALTKGMRRGAVTDPIAFYLDVMTTPPVLVPFEPLMLRALELSTIHRIGVYDCLYVALAEREGCDLVTADDRLVRNLSVLFPFVVGLDSLP